MTRPVGSHLEAVTRDGLRLSIERLAPQRGRARGAVVLQHGLGSNRLGFVLPGLSFAQYLAELGFDCYVPELRGAGESERPRAGWTIDDYLERDIPAVIDCVLGTSGQARLTWIGHSLGGLLMLMYGIERPDAPVERLVAIASALDYRPGRNVYRTLMRLRPLVSALDPVPFALLARACARVAGVGPRLLPEGMNFHRPNVERAVCRAILAAGFAPIPVSLLESLATTFSEQGFWRQAQAGHVIYLERAHALRLPTLLLGGSRDPQCPPLALQATFDRLTGVEHKRMHLFGREHGHSEDYGHFDLIVGKRARYEVWPRIAEFLNA